MPRVLVVTDEPWIRNEVHASLGIPGFFLLDEEDPRRVTDRVVADAVDVVVIDLQVKNMGGMAIIRTLRADLLAAGGQPIPTVLLLDRGADAFLARRAGADAWVQKPFTAAELRSAITAIVTVEVE